MSDFTVTSTNKTALRKLAGKIADLVSLDNLVQDVLTKIPGDVLRIQPERVPIRRLR